MLWLKRFCMLIFKIYLIGFFIINFLIYIIAKKSKIEADPTLEKIALFYPLIEINKNVFYYKGLYINDDFIFFSGQKIKHYKNKNFILNVLRITKR